jgi:hypothetical protein
MKNIDYSKESFQDNALSSWKTALRPKKGPSSKELEWKASKQINRDKVHVLPKIPSKPKKSSSLSCPERKALIDAVSSHTP